MLIKFVITFSTMMLN